MIRLVHQHRGYSLVDILAVVALIGILSAIAVPMTGIALSGQRFKGDAQALTNMVGLAKMQASAGFTRARLRANVDTRTFVVERWDKSGGTWVPQGPAERTFTGVRFGFDGIAAAPPNTQGAIGQSPPCRVGLTAASEEIGNTACIVFNSRGMPVDGDGAVFGGHALYLTNGSAVYATTVTAGPRVRLWWRPLGTGDWTAQQ
jgi:hypothetical protein